MEFVVDENVPSIIATRLRADGHTVVSISEVSPRALDEQVLAQSISLDAVLLTIDKDFGELVFRLGMGSKGVALIRLAGLSTQLKADTVAEAIAEIGGQMRGAFTVIAPGRVRVRPPAPGAD